MTQVAAATELNILVATGIYTYHDVPQYFHYLGPGYKVPRTLEFVEQPLRDDAGKARRSAVRADVIARSPARVGH